MGYMTLEQLHTVLTLAKSRSLRDYTLFFTLYKSGRRISEVLALKPRDIDIKNCRIIWNILKRREKTRRWFDVDSELITVLNHFISISSDDENERVFTISRQRVFQIVRYYFEKAGIDYIGEKRPHPHHFRHSFSIHFIQSGHTTVEDLRFLQEYLGHSNINTTTTYLQFGSGIMKEKLKEMPKLL